MQKQCDHQKGPHFCRAFLRYKGSVSTFYILFVLCSFTPEAMIQPTLPDFVRICIQPGPLSGENLLTISIMSPLRTAALGIIFDSREWFFLSPRAETFTIPGRRFFLSAAGRELSAAG